MLNFIQYFVDQHLKTKVFNCCWTELLIIFQLQLIFLQLKVSIPGTEEEVTRPSDDNEPFSALAFKVMTDPFVGKLTFFRVYSGTLDSGSYVKNTVKDKRERIGRILQMHANHREEISTVYSGEIAAAVGLKDTATGDTLCDEKHQLSWNPWNSQNQLFL